MMASNLPLVAQFSKLEEHRFGIGLSPDSREHLAQPRDDSWIVKTEEGIDQLLFGQSGDTHCGGLQLASRTRAQLRLMVVRFAIQSELQVAHHVLVSRVHAGRFRQERELPG